LSPARAVPRNNVRNDPRLEFYRICNSQQVLVRRLRHAAFIIDVLKSEGVLFIQGVLDADHRSPFVSNIFIRGEELSVHFGVDVRFDRNTLDVIIEFNPDPLVPLRFLIFGIFNIGFELLLDPVPDRQCESRHGRGSALHLDKPAVARMVFVILLLLVDEPVIDTGSEIVIEFITQPGLYIELFYVPCILIGPETCLQVKPETLPDVLFSLGLIPDTVVGILSRRSGSKEKREQ